MDMKKYLAALQAKEATQQANFGNDADTVLGMLCSTYYELNCNQDTDEVKQAFDELYQAMTGKPSRKKMRSSTPPVASVASTNKPASSMASALASNSPKN